MYDIAIIGGGTAGAIAAIQAGRAGASTLLVEKNGILGGTTTIGGVDRPGLFHAWGRQVIAGIGWDLVRRCVEEAGLTFPDFITPPRSHSHQQVTIDRAVYAALLDQEVLEAGVELLLHAMLARVEDRGAAKRLTLCTKTGLHDVEARVVIDATGDANAVAIAGLPVARPEGCQPGTLRYLLSGYDPEALDLEAIEAAYQRELAEGRLLPTDTSWDARQGSIRGFLLHRGDNANHIPMGVTADSAARTQVELEARRSFLRVYRFLRAQPGLERLRVQMPPECGIRESVTIVGEVTVTAEDYRSGRRWEDAVCYAFYPIDLHMVEGGLDKRYLEPGTVPTIPRRALLPRGSRNWLVAGRCLSSDRLANSALRVQASSMAMGQAAGALAALAARGGTTVAEVPLPELYALLREHGAIVPA